MSNFSNYTNLASIMAAIKSKFAKKTDFPIVSQAEYNALIQEGTLDPNASYYVYNAQVTGAVIDDTTTANDKLWSSQKTNNELSSKASIDDTTASATKAWSSQKTNSELTNSNKATVLTVSTSSWVADTTSQSGTTLYKKEISLSHVYVPCPEVAIGASGTTLPTKAQQTAYDLVQYATVDSSTNKLYLYASAVPSTQFYIKVTGVD